MKRFFPLTLPVLAFALASCGDVGNVSVKLTFADPALEAATRRLEFVVRDGDPSGNGCSRLWTANTGNFAENRSQIDYPNKNPVVVAPVMLAKYPRLTLLVYAHPSKDVMNSAAIAGGCQDVMTDQSATVDIAIVMMKPPAGK